MELKKGDKAPSFTLKDQDARSVSLKDFDEKWLVIYFYPKDNTPGCTIEAREFSKNLKRFKELNTLVIGVSPDSGESHCKFIDRFKLQVTLLSDPDHKVMEKYGAWKQKSMFGKKYMGVQRSTFLIGPDKKIAHAWYGVRVAGHVKDVLEKIKEVRS